MIYLVFITLVFTHFCNFRTPLYLGCRCIPNIAILDVVILNEVVGGDGGGIDKKKHSPYFRPLIGLYQIKTENINVEKTVRTKVL